MALARDCSREIERRKIHVVVNVSSKILFLCI